MRRRTRLSWMTAHRSRLLSKRSSEPGSGNVSACRHDLSLLRSRLRLLPCSPRRSLLRGGSGGSRRRLRQPTIAINRGWLRRVLTGLERLWSYLDVFSSTVCLGLYFLSPPIMSTPSRRSLGDSGTEQLMGHPLAYLHASTNKPWRLVWIHLGLKSDNAFTTSKKRCCDTDKASLLTHGH
jgi:hypothetical protein